MKKFLPYIICFVCLLPLCISRDLTPSNELRYLSIADEALRDGHIFAFYNQGEAYADKPPLYIWIIMFFKWLTGSHQVWLIELFSLLPALALTAIMNRWTKPLLKDSVGNTGVWMLMSAGLFLGTAVFMRMDMLMCLFITLALYRFYKDYKSEKSKVWCPMFMVYTFLALFTKGPVGLLVPMLSVPAFLLWKKQGKLIGRYIGWRNLLLLLGMCLLWFGAVYIEAGTEYLNNLVVHQTVDRAVNAFRHQEPFYYYLMIVWYAIAPWSIWAVVTLIYASCKRLLNEDLEQFFMVVILTTLVMLSAFSSKLAIYLAPAFAFIIYLALLLSPKTQWKGAWSLTLSILPCGIFVLALPAMFVLASLPDTAYLGHWAFYIAGGLLSLSGIAGLWMIYGKKDWMRSVRITALGLFIAVAVGSFGMKGLNPYLGYRDMCQSALELAKENPQTNGFCVWEVRRAEGLEVFLGEDAKILEKAELLQGQARGKVLMVENKYLNREPEVQTYLLGKPSHLVGNHTIFVL